MIKIDENLYVILNIGSANIFCIGTPETYILIDTGIFMQTKKLITELNSNHFTTSNLKTILITHCHCDHIGGVKELLDHSNARVAAHQADIPFILRESVIDGPYREMMIEEQKAMQQLNCAVPRIDIELKDGDTIENLEVISVPGHTPGSVAFFQKEKGWMFFGDVIRENRKEELSIGKPERFNIDMSQVIKDARKLLSYPIKIGLLSHGKIYSGKEIEILRNLLTNPDTFSSGNWKKNRDY